MPSAYTDRLIFSAVSAEEEYCQCAGSGVRTDNGTRIIYHYIFDAQTLADKVCRVFGILDAVAVADEHGLRRGVDGGLRHFIYKSFERSLSAARFSDIYKMTFVIYVHYGLYGKHGAHNGSCRGNAPAALKEKQIVVSSDAHYLWDINEAENFFPLEDEPYSGEIERRNLFKMLKGEEK